MPLLVVTGATVSFSDFELLHIILAGLANSGGLLLVYTAYARTRATIG